MAWVKTLPGNTEKIRNLGVVIRPNWEAIEEADLTFKPHALNYNNRTPLGVANDPAAIADTHILYCKDDGSANPEMFSIDDTSVISQLTFRDRSLAQSGYVYLAPGFILQWGRATILAGTNTIAVTFPLAFGATAYSVTCNPLGATAGDTTRGFGPVSITDVGFTATSHNVSFTGNTDVTWIAIGPM
jgi:hypothetical protein